ncbi:MAG: DUF4268 domain-containing protein [Candidatus Bathyarchaeia archaeon]
MSLIIRKRNQPEVILKTENFEKDKNEEDLHKLLENNIDILAYNEDEKFYLLGSHLKIRGSEIDLLLTNEDGDLTIVELKRGRTPREVIAQILEYASILHNLDLDELEKKVDISKVFNKIKEVNPDLEYDEEQFFEKIKECLKSGKFNLLIVSYEIDETIKDIMNYLRDVYEVKIQGIEFKYYKDKNSEFEIFAMNPIGEEEVEEIENKELTPSEKRNIEIFSELLEDFKERNPGVTYRKSTKGNYLRIPAGYSGIHFEWVIHKDWVEVGLHFEKSNKDENLKILKFFQDKKSELENKIHEGLTFDENWGENWTRIYAKRSRDNLGDDVKKWMKDVMNAFYEKLKPYLDEYFSSFENEK